MDIPRGITAPPGEWETFSEDELVRGCSHFPNECAEFVHGLTETGAVGGKFGIHLERDPMNVVDPYAVKAIGFWTDANGTVHHRQIGFLAKGLVWRMHNELNTDDPIATEMLTLETHPDYLLNIKVDVLNQDA